MGMGNFRIAAFIFQSIAILKDGDSSANIRIW